ARMDCLSLIVVDSQTPTLLPYATLFRSAVKYKGKEYKNADRINVGVSGTADLPAWSGTGPGVPFSFSVAVSTPTKVYRVTIPSRSEEHTSELQSRDNLVCRLLLEEKK